MALTGDTNNDGVLSPEEIAKMGRGAASQAVWESEWGGKPSTFQQLNLFRSIPAFLRSTGAFFSPEGGRQYVSEQQQKRDVVFNPALLRSAGLPVDPRELAKKRAADVRRIYAMGAGGGDGGYAAAQRAALANYINNILGYAKAQGSGIASGYQDLAEEVAARGAETAYRGVGAGVSAEDIYNQLAANVAAYNAGQGLATPAGELAGMVGPSGAAAEAPAAAMTEGASLSNYLGEMGTAARDLAQTMSEAYRAQGVGTAAEMLNAAQAAAAAQRYAVDQAIANQRAQAAAARNNARMQAELKALDIIAAGDLAYEQQRQQAAITSALAPQLWAQLSPEERKRDFGDSLAGFRQYLISQPSALQAYQMRGE